MWRAEGTWTGRSTSAEQLPELLPDFIQGWLLLQDAGLDNQERGIVMNATGEDYSVEAIAHAMRSLFTDGDMKKRDSNRRQHGFWGAVDEENQDEPHGDLMDDYEAQETLDDDSFAMWSEAQHDAQEALAAIGVAKRTLREARAKQHAVKMSRQYYKVGSRPSSSSQASGNRPRDDSQIVCLRCQKKGHRAANCPLPPPTAHMAQEETASFICYAEDLVTDARDYQISEKEYQNTEKEDQITEKEVIGGLVGGLDSVVRDELIGYSEDANLAAEAALATGITTLEAIDQGKAILDCGATRSIGSVYAIEKLMEMNVRAKGTSGVVSVDTNKRPVFSFGNSSMNQCASTVKMGITAGNRSGAVQIHALDHGQGPILLSVESLGMLGAMIDFQAKMVVLRNIDATKILPLEQTATGHLVVPLSEDLLAKALNAVQKVPGLDQFLARPADESGQLLSDLCPVKTGEDRVFVAGQYVENRDVSASAVQASRCDPEDVSEKQGYQGLGVISDESESRVAADRNDAELRDLHVHAMQQLLPRSRVTNNLPAVPRNSSHGPEDRSGAQGNVEQPWRGSTQAMDKDRVVAEGRGGDGRGLHPNHRAGEVRVPHVHVGPEPSGHPGRIPCRPTVARPWTWR